MSEDIPRRRFVLGVAATGLSLGLAGCSSGSAGSSDSPTDSPTEESSSGGESWERTDTIEMTDDLTFVPKKVEVEAGTTVTWKNVGSIGHSVTAYEDKIPDGADYFASGGFDSQQAAEDGYPDKGNITEGGTYEHTFETKGEYEYYCIPHEMNGMVGTIRVI